ncbi:hypothetical protein V1264_003298 [Littorina saxatilis]|uniref:[histone H4]-N-methyl-L-lysine(20) N-methyltransferase n=2 Tax=Littorina saxatilis TaxID=31220 RepID=A0AAN9G9S4_9CAEN
MTTEELCRYDDICTALIIDPYMGFQTHKMNIRFRPLSNQAELKRIVEEFIHDQDYEKTHDKLLAVDPRRVSPLIKTEREQNLMRQHIYCFLKMFDNQAGFEIQPCERYSLEDQQGGKIVATKAWKKGQVISMLVGCVGELTPEQERELLVWGQNDYSVQYSDRKKKSQLWLGPAAYMNHDCRPNCSFHATACTAAARLQVIRNIAAGDEIVLSYGDGFFTDEYGNSSCECNTCEELRRGAFRPKENAIVEEPRERLRQVPSRMSTRAEQNMQHARENWTSRARRLEASAALLKSDDLRKLKVTRYDAELMIESNHFLSDVGPRKVAQQATPLGSVSRSRHNSGLSRASSEQSGVCTDLSSSNNSASNLSASTASADAACSLSNPCTPRPRVKRSLSLARKSGSKRARVGSLLDTGDENQPILTAEILPESEREGNRASLWPGKMLNGPGFDLDTGSTTVKGIPLSSRKNSVHAQSLGPHSQPANGLLSSHMTKIKAVKGEGIRQSPRLRPRQASASFSGDYVDSSDVPVGGCVVNGAAESEEPTLEDEEDNDDSGLGEMTVDPFDKSLDSNHNFHDPPVLEPQVPFVPYANTHTSFSSLAQAEEDSDQDLNKSSSSSVPQLSLCGSVASLLNAQSPSQDIPHAESWQKRQRKPTMKLRIKLEHPNQHKLHDFNRQLEREGKSQFVQIEPKETRAVRLTSQTSVESTRSGAGGTGLDADIMKTFLQPLGVMTEPVSVQPPVRLRLRSDKSGTVFQCLSPKPAACIS